MANLSFKVKFEEIWDFNITMLDWQVDDLKKQDSKADTISTKVKVDLTTGKKVWSKASSEVAKNDF